MQGTWVQSLVREDPTRHRATESVHPNYWDAVLELQPKACALQQEKPLQWEACTLQLERNPCSPQLETAHTQQERASAAKNDSVNK